MPVVRGEGVGNRSRLNGLAPDFLDIAIESEFGLTWGIGHQSDQGYQ